MRKIILYAAISLDGKIAKPDGNIDWLHNLPNPEQEDHGYVDFMASVDTTIMGNKTYQQVLGFDMPFPYQDKTNYVLTRNQTLHEDEYATFISDQPIVFAQELKAKEGKDIWLVGGGEITTMFLKNRLIDELQLFIMPIILGPGIPLFGEELNQDWLELKSSKRYGTGAVGITYNFKND
jgi:dihydrofolate reductase